MTATVRILITVAAAGLAGCAVDQQAEVETYRAVTRLHDVPAFAPGDPLALADALKLANAY
ncbi:hypothetical protein, partial [Salmonella enterica]|uniref:hypothetical protein n=1 Tax=Salmonella enterica TaxID=28901 RepID=UPI0013A538A5